MTTWTLILIATFAFKPDFTAKIEGFKTLEDCYAFAPKAIEALKPYENIRHYCKISWGNMERQG